MKRSEKKPTLKKQSKVRSSGKRLLHILIKNMRSHLNYVPQRCENCNQTCTYLLALDAGTADIVKAIALFIKKKGINAVHPRKEMEGIYLTSNQVGNLSHARFHGLIAAIEGQKGNYCLTRKGLKFLNGEVVESYAIISKPLKRQIGYYLPEKFNCVIDDFNVKDKPYWEGIGYSIQEGQVIVVI